MEIMNKEKNEIKKTTKDMKEEFNKEMEDFRKKSNRNPGNKIP
jgi:hypothetical protein